MTPEPVFELDEILFLEVDASLCKAPPWGPGELEKWLEMMKKHSPGNYRYYMEQRALREKQQKPTENDPPKENEKS